MRDSLLFNIMVLFGWCVVFFGYILMSIGAYFTERYVLLAGVIFALFFVGGCIVHYYGIIRDKQ